MTLWPSSLNNMEQNKGEMHFFTGEEIPALLKTIRGTGFKPIDWNQSREVPWQEKADSSAIEASLSVVEDQSILPINSATRQSNNQSPEVTNG